MIWLCPKCSTPLIGDKKSLVCVNGHGYDRAKQGYANLLLANQKGSLDPGDNERMISARRNFLRSDHYSPLLDAVFAEINGMFTGVDKGLTILDLGCGEGYYLEGLVKKFLAVGEGIASVKGYGVDISKVAVRKASASAKQWQSSRQDPSEPMLDYAVGSSAHIPVSDGSVDCVLVVFAPVETSELVRVLKPGGVFIRVVPGPNHLLQLRGEIYSEVRPHTKQVIESGFTLKKEVSVEYLMTLNSGEAIEQLFEMTPFGWRGTAGTKKSLVDKGVLQVNADFLIQVCSIKKA